MTPMFSLTEHHVEFRTVVRQICVDRIAPRAAEIDETGEFPWDVKEVMADNGLLGLHIPEEYGGSGADTLTFCILVEEVARVCASSSIIPLVQKLGSMPITMGASDAQKSDWFPAIASGEQLISYCLSEPGAGSDPAAMLTSARREGDEWVLDGTKVWISNAGVSSLYAVLPRPIPPPAPAASRPFWCAPTTPASRWASTRTSSARAARRPPRCTSTAAASPRTA